MMTPNEILEMALEKETQAKDFYEKLAVDSSVDFVTDLLRKLQNEEAKHIRMIQEIAARLESGRELK